MNFIQLSFGVIVWTLQDEITLKVRLAYHSYYTGKKC